MENVLIKPEELAQRMAEQSWVVLHTSMANPATGKMDNLTDVYLPGAIHFDFETVVCNVDSSLPHTLPSEEQMEQHLSALGITAQNKVVVYDDVGIYCAPRVWFMLRWAGVKQVQVLDGGLPCWLEKGLPTQSYLNQAIQVKDQSRFEFQPARLKTCEQILNSLHNQEIQVIDARSAGRFHGLAPEPRANLRSGHIPNSLNVPFTEVLNGITFKDSVTLKHLFEQQGANFNAHWTFTCGSGVTACILALAAELMGHYAWSIYDGSWSEWGANPSLPVSAP